MSPGGHTDLGHPDLGRPDAAAGRDHPPVVLAYRTLGLGDLLTAVPALRGLARAHPHHRLVLAAPAAVGGLLLDACVVDEVVDVPELGTIPRELHGVRLAVNLHGAGPQSHARLLDADPCALLAFRHPQVPGSHDGPDWHDAEHEVVRWCRLVEHHGGRCDRDDLQLPTPRAAVPAGVAGATVVHPGAKSGARRWPPERFAAVAAAERAAGRRVVVTGSAAEVALAERVAELAGLPSSAVLAGRTELTTLAAVIAAAGRVVCGDTGVAHLATAFGTPSVVVFGPTPPERWGPPATRRDRHRVLWAGQTGDALAPAPFAGLLEITVDDVSTALDALPGHHLPIEDTEPACR